MRNQEENDGVELSCGTVIYDQVESDHHQCDVHEMASYLTGADD